MLAELAGRGEAVRAFIDRAAVTVDATAAHRTPLGEAVRRLPAMLDAARPGLQSLDRAMASGTPLLGALDASAPGLRTLTTTLPQFGFSEGDRG